MCYYKGERFPVTNFFFFLFAIRLACFVTDIKLQVWNKLYSMPYLPAKKRLNIPFIVYWKLCNICVFYSSTSHKPANVTNDFIVRAMLLLNIRLNTYIYIYPHYRFSSVVPCTKKKIILYLFYSNVSYIASTVRTFYITFTVTCLHITWCVLIPFLH